MRTLHRILIFSTIIASAALFVSVNILLMSVFYVALRKYSNIAGGIVWVSFMLILCLLSSLILFKKFSKTEYASDLNVFPVNKNGWHKFRYRVVVAVLIYVISIMLAKNYLFNYTVDLKNGYYLRGDDNYINLYNEKGTEIVIDVYKYKEINNLVIGYAGPWAINEGEPNGYFVVDANVGSTSKGLEKEDYLRSLKIYGIDNEPTLMEPNNDNKK